MAGWNLWHGCHKLSPGCLNCYVYRTDSRHDRDASQVRRTGSFDLPLRRDRQGRYKLAPGETVYTCFTSDFFLGEADEWRREAWDIIRLRSDLSFFIVTKRIDRFFVSLPDDWGDGWDNVTIFSTAENQQTADYRLPILRAAPIKHKGVAAEPLLERIDFSAHLGSWLEALVLGGESGEGARVCDYDWVLDIRAQCISAGVPFTFRQTGANFRRGGRVYSIPRRLQHSQARRAGIDT